MQRQPWEGLAPENPETILELSLDGGNVKLNTGPKDEPDWRQYKAVRINSQGESRAWFQDNEALIETLSNRAMAAVVVCLGDGHDGIWNLHEAIVPELPQRLEVLDWYHLKENLYHLSSQEVDRDRVESHLWKGDVQGALSELEGCDSEAAAKFRKHLLKHQHRIPNYDYYAAEDLCSVGSGAVESLVKQIDQRLQIVGSRWKPEHVPKVLAQRCAYLNEELEPSSSFLSRK